jgi:hypothetical protein
MMKMMKDKLFMGLLHGLHLQAMVSMGKIENPISGKIEKNIEMARLNIELLEELKQKTNGNLEKIEENELVKIISELQITFIEEVALIN